MDYYDSALFYPAFSEEDKVRLFSVFGGIPYYNRLVDGGLTVRENLLELIVEPGARLENVGMELVQKTLPINAPDNRKKASYRIVDGLSSFYYRYIFRYASQRSFMDPESFFDRYVGSDFETRYVPHAFEEVCRQYLIRQNRARKLPELFDLIGRYSYDDPASRKSGEFDVVTRDPNGYIFYEAKFRSTPVTGQIVAEEVAQVRATGLDCYRYGFFSRSGFSLKPDDRTVLIDLKDMFA